MGSTNTNTIMAGGAASAINLWNRPSQEELDRDGVCAAFIKMFDYLDKNEDGLVGVNNLAVYLADCGLNLSDDNLAEMEKFANEDKMLNQNGIQHYAVKCSLYDTFVAKTK